MASDDSPGPGPTPFQRFSQSGASALRSLASVVGGGLRGLISWPALATLALGLVALHLFGLISIPFPPFTTTGRIYVDSPEVYTRERLVNDRYDQDFWLRERLKLLDSPEKLRLTVGEERLVGSIGAGTGGTVDGDGKALGGGAAPNGESRQLSFEQELRVAAGIRDMIRQQILENMLDDRHDLTGNSVYGLKFDTTVIPGNNTRRRAFVHVSLTVDDQFRPTDGSTPGPPPQNSSDRSESKLGGHIDGWVATQLAPYRDETYRDATAEQRNRFRKQEEYFQEWLHDIGRRLNRAEDSVYESMSEACRKGDRRAFYDRLTGRTLEIVLGIPDEAFWRLNGPGASGKPGGVAAPDTGKPVQIPPLKLPDPWDKFLVIDREQIVLPDEGGQVSCDYRVWFKVHGLDERFVVAPVDDAGQGSDEPIAESADSKWLIMVPAGLSELRRSWFEEPGPKYRLTSDLINTLISTEEQLCLHRTGKACAESARRDILVNSGLFNFIERMGERDAYSYAIFPKNDVVGVFAETRAQVSASAAPTGFFDLAKQLAETRTASVLVGFGDGGASDPADATRRGDPDRSIDFGWVISGQGAMEPSLKSQLALVSVPAWTNRLHMRVSVGWLDRSGTPEIDPNASFELSVAVPPSYEVFDSIFREGAQVKLGPSIRDNEMDRDIYVQAGRETKILIPGSRLWRSAAVTLGTQMAGRIRVLPNMEGIVAEFDRVDLPYAAANPMEDADGNAVDESAQCQRRMKDILAANLRVRATPLRVWTSEGMAKAKPWVCVIYDPKEVLGVSPAAPAGASP